MKKILHIYFFGYAAYRYRRLIRTLVLLIFFVSAFSIGFDIYMDNIEYDIALKLFGILIGGLLITALVSFLIEPFIIEKKL